MFQHEVEDTTAVAFLHYANRLAAFLTFKQQQQLEYRHWIHLQYIFDTDRDAALRRVIFNGFVEPQIYSTDTVPWYDSSQSIGMKVAKHSTIAVSKRTRQRQRLRLQLQHQQHPNSAANLQQIADILGPRLHLRFTF
jgi:hypothetical protein